MIKIIVRYDDLKNPVGLEAKGHAESGPYGYDLVCAAVSAVITGGANALDESKKWKVKLSKGDAEIVKKADCELVEEDHIIMRTIITMLRTIAESYPKFVQITEK